VNIVTARKLLKGSKFEHLSDERIHGIIQTMRPFISIAAEKAMEYQSTIAANVDTNSYISPALLHQTSN
jgi:hypothetical protein